ncbi:MAG: hypothetical protein IH957_01485 [Chloroflexi bacterium]|nr:hypothetical protein [Chloroflexota bacterium]
MLLAIVAGGAAPASAGALIVTRFDDPAPDGCAPQDCSLREAIIAANAADGSDTIELAAGTYKLEIAGTDEDEAATGDLDIASDLTLTGAGADTTAIDADGIDRVFDITGAPVVQTVAEPADHFVPDPTFTVNISAVTIRNGSLGTDGGGGIRNSFSSLTLNETIISDNTAGFAGGIANLGDDALLTVTDSTINGNSASAPTGVGGGIFNDGGSVTINRSTVSANTAALHGGGLFIDGGTVTIDNSTLSGNRANWSGGAVRSNATVFLDYVTITNNTADDDGDGTGGGGGIAQTAGTFWSGSSIIAGNIDPTGDPDCFGAVSTGWYNLFGEISPGCTLENLPAFDLIGLDPMLGPLADNGGPTQTHALLLHSPAIGLTVDCPPPATDQRGIARVEGNSCDAGAYEFQSPLWGDGDCDNDVDAVDALVTLQFVADLPFNQGDPCFNLGKPVNVSAAGSNETNYGEIMWGDVDCDDGVGAIDALGILRFVAKLGSTPQVQPCPRFVNSVIVS